MINPDFNELMHGQYDPTRSARWCSSCKKWIKAITTVNKIYKDHFTMEEFNPDSSFIETKFYCNLGVALTSNAEQPVSPQPTTQQTTQQAELIQDGIEKTLSERGSKYGEFKDHAEITQNLKTIMSFCANWRSGKLAFDQREALEMIAHKIGRILNGDPNYIDSWVDIEGYANLVTQRLKKEQGVK